VTLTNVVTKHGTFVQGADSGGVARFAAMEQMLGGRKLYSVDLNLGGGGSWSGVTGGSWGDYVNTSPPNWGTRRDVFICTNLALAVGTVMPRMTPAQIAPNLDATAAGANDDVFEIVATRMLAAGHGTAAHPIYLRLGHEADGDWYPWNYRGSHNGIANVVRYKAAFRHVAALFKARSPGFLTVFESSHNGALVQNPATPGQTYFDGAYPGSDLTDVIGHNVYAHNSRTYVNSNVFPIASATQAKAASLGKPIGISEWGIHYGETGDADWFIRDFVALMATWPDTGAGRLVYNNYFWLDSPNRNHTLDIRLSSGALRTPLSYNLYRSIFSDVTPDEPPPPPPPPPPDPVAIPNHADFLQTEDGEYLMEEDDIGNLRDETGAAPPVEPEPEDPDPPPTNPPPELPPPAPPADEWSIDLCVDWVRVAQVEAYKFAGIENFNEAGEFSLECSPAGVPAWSPTGALNAQGQPVFYGPQDVDTIRVVRSSPTGAVIEYAGLVWKVGEGAGGFESTMSGGQTVWRWTGPDLWGYLTTRLAFPNPATEPPWPTFAHDVRTGRASSVLAGYISANIGPTALPARRWPRLEVDDAVVGPTMPFSARLQPLDELAKRIAGDAGLRVRVVVEFDRAVTVTVDTPRDRSETVVFSDQGDLANVKMRRTPLSVSWALAGGQGEGTARAFAVAPTVGSPTGAARRETFSDQSSMTQAAELSLAAQAAVRDGAATWTIDADVTDAILSAWRYGRDFSIGDLIRIEVAGVRYTVPIVSASFDLTHERQVVKPRLGTAVPDELAGLIRDVNNLASRFGRNIA
jgi:hypothetical protein